MLSTHHLQITINERVIVPSLDLTVPTGSSLAIIGVSGSGKTTLLNALGLILPLGAGTLTIDDQDFSSVTSRSRQRFWSQSAAFVLQDYGLIDEESVAYNVMLSNPPFIKRTAITQKRVLEALERVGLRDRAASTVASLSGGEKQRVSIARALYKNANYLFADEPTASLDAGNRRQVADMLLGDLNRDRTVIISTHDPELAARCDATLRLGPPEEGRGEGSSPVGG